jgi:hypothetical protein
MPESEITDEMDVRPPKKKWNHARVDIRYFSIQVSSTFPPSLPSCLLSPFP